jgi:hypothetical protein
MRITLIFCLFMAFGISAHAQLSVSNSPTGAAVVITQPSAVSVTWSINGASAGSTVVSEEGLFVLNGETLGRVDTFLTTSAGAAGNGTSPTALTNAMQERSFISANFIPPQTAHQASPP